MAHTDDRLRPEVRAAADRVAAAPAGRAPEPGERLLWQEARAAARRAYAPYSGFKVGAALIGASGRTHLGVNVENQSYPAGMCAERVALGAAVTAGERPSAVAVATTDGRDAVPCGLCLQAFSEFGDVTIVCRHGGEVRVFALRELLTTPFAVSPDAAEGRAR